MDDIIFEKDYRETESAEYDKWCDEVFDRAVNCGMLKAYSEAMDKIPILAMRGLYAQIEDIQFQQITLTSRIKDIESDISSIRSDISDLESRLGSSDQ